MPLKFSSIDETISGIPLELTSYFFQNKQDSLEIQPGGINISDENDFLNHCFVVRFKDFCLIRSNPIDSREKAHQLELLLGKLFDGKPRRHCSLQLSCPETEWETIASQHQVLFEMEEVIPHINFSLEELFVPKIPSFQLPAARKANEKLAIFQNASSWLIYGDWYEEAIEAIRSHIQTADLEFYTLEASLDDFMKEANSSYIKEARRDIATMLKRIAELEPTVSANSQGMIELIALEKELLLRRYELVQTVHAECVALDAIVENTQKVEATHPFMQQLREQGSLLSSLMWTQTDQEEVNTMPRGQQIMLFQLLNAAMDVDTFTCCGTGLERTSFAFSIQLATLIMVEKYSIEELLPVAKNWREKRGTELGIELRHLVWEVFLRLSVPVIQQVPAPGEFVHDETDIISEQWRLFLPDKVEKRLLANHLSLLRSPE